MKEDSSGEREINMATTQPGATLAYLKWLETTITFDRSDHANHIKPPGRFPLVVSVIVSGTRLTKVLMDGGSRLNILYTRMYDALGLPRASIRSTSAPSMGLCLGYEPLLSSRSLYPPHLEDE